MRLRGVGGCRNPESTAVVYGGSNHWHWHWHFSLQAARSGGEGDAATLLLSCGGVCVSGRQARPRGIKTVSLRQARHFMPASKQPID